MNEQQQAADQAYQQAPQGNAQYAPNSGAQQQAQGQQTPYESPAYMPSRGLNFLLSLIPGAGHMYQGLMRRGVLLMALFAGAITLAGVFGNISHFGLGGLLVGAAITAIVVIYFFSFFDSMRTCRLIRSGIYLGNREQDLLLELPSVKFPAAGRGRKIIGVILVVIGALGLFGYIINEFVPYEWFDYYVRPALNILLPLAFLVAGIVLLMKGKPKKETV